MNVNSIMISKTTSKVLSENSIRKIFYQGTTTLDDMTLDRVQATIYDAVRYSAKTYQKLPSPLKFLFGIKKTSEIKNGIIPNIESTFRLMHKRMFKKLQKALVIIENPKNVKPKLYQNACDFYNEIADTILNKVVYK